MNRPIHILIAAIAIAFAGSAASADPTQEWSLLAAAAANEAREAPEAAARSRRLVREAMAAASAHAGNGNGNGNGNGSTTSAGERQAAAVAVAAFAMLEALYPEQRESLDARLAVTFSHIPESDAKAQGAAIGRRVAQEMLGSTR